jgi:hypothetical protein
VKNAHVALWHDRHLHWLWPEMEHFKHCMYTFWMLYVTFDLCLHWFWPEMEHSEHCIHSEYLTLHYKFKNSI